MKAIFKDALKSNELKHLLFTWIESDPKKQSIEDFTPAELIQEANWILYTCEIGDNFLIDDLEDKNADVRKDARRELKTLKAFVKKYGGTI